MPADGFSHVSDSIIAPSRQPFAIVPSDSVELSAFPKAIYVGIGDDIVLRGVDGQADVTFRNVPAGQVLDVRPRYIRATGTTAGALVRLG